MRRTPLFAALAFGLMLGLSAPVLADHVSEPTSPITGTRMRVYQYTDKVTPHQSVRNDGGLVSFVNGCDGSQTVFFDNMRMETFVQAKSVRLNENPSEHYVEQVGLYVVTNPGLSTETMVYEWSSEWKHQNIPPHAKPGGGSDRGWESSSNNQRLSAYAPGTILRWLHELRAYPSGGVFIETCTFIVG